MQKVFSRIGIALLIQLIAFAVYAEADRRVANAPADLNTPRVFPKFETRAEWQSRAETIREQILVSCGLWPMPAKAPLKTKMFGRVDRDGYSVEKVYFQSYPGFYVAGNLYRPRGIKGPYPAVLSPHGHWAHGRLNDEKDGSIPARCINMAKQGYIVFAYDMVGYNDTFFADQKNIPATATNINFYPRHRAIETNEANNLWNFSLMGLQTWDSIRALDFLESLPEVDKKRIGVTGASGGATQTLILGAIDHRITAQAPVCMVSSTMQGGCACETAPGLRVDYSNMEIAALPAPRPQILVAATGDWTKMTLTYEGPAIETVYRQFGAEDKLRYVIGDFGHNYNKTSREQVYDWFGKWLKPAKPNSKEVAYTKETDEELRVFPDGKLPDDALPMGKFLQDRIESADKQFRDLLPKNAAGLATFKKTFIPAWHHTLQVELPGEDVEAAYTTPNSLQSYMSMRVVLSGTHRGDRLPAVLLSPGAYRRNIVVVLVHPEGKGAFFKSMRPTGFAERLLDKGASVLLLDTFLTGELADTKADEARKNARKKQTDLFFTCYNRTDMQERVQDLITACAFAKTLEGNPTVILCGVGRAGLSAVVAAPAADAVVADVDQLDTASDKELLKPDVFVPGLKKIGGFEGSALLAAPNPILLHNTGEKFSSETLLDVYGKLKALKSTSVVPNRLSDEDILNWLVSLGEIKSGESKRR